MYQKLTIVGNLGRDPEMRYTPNGQAVTNLNVATNYQYTSSTGERVKETTWFRVSVWGRQGEVANQYLKRGSKVLIEGRLTADQATGGPRVFQRQDGTYGSSFELRARNVVFLSTREEDQSYQDNVPGDEFDQEDDDIPF